VLYASIFTFKKVKMKKKIFIGLGIFAILIVVAILYLNNRNRTLSPAGSASLTSGDLSVSITYSRPYVRGRVIFGTKEEGALQPYGEYWRLGANESTEITFNMDVNFNSQSVKAGTYRMYAIPGPSEFEIILNTGLGEWGAFEPDHALDLLSTKIPVAKPSSPVEQFTINLEQTENGINVICEMAETRFVIPVAAN
jgi:hypothetical protein